MQQLWRDHPADVIAVVEGARNAWIQASPQYEKMEGIVAGTPTLADYDVILDAGASGAEDPENAAPIDLTLADGRVLARPGNLFGVTESTLWGTYPAYTAGVDADLDQDGLLEFGETLPDAAVLQAGANALNDYAGKLLAAAETWTPNTSDAFTALVVMVPTMSEYFEVVAQLSLRVGRKLYAAGFRGDFAAGRHAGHPRRLASCLWTSAPVDGLGRPGTIAARSRRN